MGIKRRAGAFGGKGRQDTAEHQAAAADYEVKPLLIERLKPRGKTELYLRDAEYAMIYVTVPSGVGLKGTTEALRPLPHMLRLFQKAVPRQVVTHELVFDAKKKPVVDALTGKQKTRVKKVEVPSDAHRVIVYNDYAREWESLTLSGDTVVSTDLDRIPCHLKPSGDPLKATVGKATARRAGAGGFKRTKPVPEAQGPDAKRRVIIVTIGVTKGLYDVGDGSHAGDIPAGTKAKNAAAKLKRVLVCRTECGAYAMHVLVEKWKQGRRDMKKMGVL